MASRRTMRRVGPSRRGFDKLSPSSGRTGFRVQTLIQPIRTDSANAFCYRGHPADEPLSARDERKVLPKGSATYRTAKALRRAGLAPAGRRGKKPTALEDKPNGRAPSSPFAAFSVPQSDTRR